jgi:hypothetical protein
MGIDYVDCWDRRSFYFNTSSNSPIPHNLKKACEMIELIREGGICF